MKIILGKHEEEVSAHWNGSYIELNIKTDDGDEATALLFEHGALELIEELNKSLNDKKAMKEEQK